MLNQAVPIVLSDIQEETIPMTLALIHPRLEQQLLLAKKVQLIDGLKVMSLFLDGAVSTVAVVWRREGGSVDGPHHVYNPSQALSYCTLLPLFF